MSEVIQKLEILKSVTCDPRRNWDILRRLVSKFDDIEVLEKEWCDDFKNKHPDMYPLNLSKIEIWSTYDGCVDIKVSHIDYTHMKIDVVIWDGDMVYGEPIQKRFTASLKVPVSFKNSRVEQTIDYRFECYLQQLHEKHLEDQQKEWMRNRKKELLGWS